MIINMQNLEKLEHALFKKSIVIDFKTREITKSQEEIIYLYYLLLFQETN